MENEFITWLTQKMNEFRWGNSELARRAGLAPSTISMVISGQKRPGLDFCVGVAQAFNLSPEDVLQKAGLIPSKPEMDEKSWEMLRLFQQLEPADQERLLQAARAWVEAGRR